MSQRFPRTCTLLLLALAALPFGPAASAADRPNILMITADDLNWDSLGCTGSKVPDVSPNLDKLAGEGMRFLHAHVTIAVCQPCRGVWITGLYPHRNGARGFEPINPQVPTLTARLSEAGYVNGILGKVTHLAPQRVFAWDYVARVNELGHGRDPERYRRHTAKFLEQAREAGKPFFLMANSHDPHRPFAGSAQEAGREKREGDYPPAPRQYEPGEVEVPGFLPDIPDVRKEIAQYFSSVHRCDRIVGAVLAALDESGLAENTVVMFLGDHGMALPFAKTNCYLNSTRTPWIVRWPGVVEPGTVDREHFISGIDFMPTVLDIAGVEPPARMDGRTFGPLLRGGSQDGRDSVYTVFHQTAARRDYPMRSVVNDRYGYIYNAWSDGSTVFHNESQSGLSMRAMVRAAQDDPDIAARVKLFKYRVPEELYDYQNDPDALVNLAHDPAHRATLETLRAQMRARMQHLHDPLLPTFDRQILKGDE